MKSIISQTNQPVSKVLNFPCLVQFPIGNVVLLTHNGIKNNTFVGTVVFNVPSSNLSVGYYFEGWGDNFTILDPNCEVKLVND